MSEPQICSLACVPASLASVLLCASLSSLLRSLLARGTPAVQQGPLLIPGNGSSPLLAWPLGFLALRSESSFLFHKEGLVLATEWFSQPVSCFPFFFFICQLSPSWPCFFLYNYLKSCVGFLWICWDLCHQTRATPTNFIDLTPSSAKTSCTLL